VTIIIIWKRSISPERGPEEIKTTGVCSFQDLGDLGEEKCKLKYDGQNKSQSAAISSSHY